MNFCNFSSKTPRQTQMVLKEIYWSVDSNAIHFLVLKNALVNALGHRLTFLCVLEPNLQKVVFFQKSISKFYVFILIRSTRTPYHAMGSTLEHPWASYRVAKVAFALCKAVQKILDTHIWIYILNFYIVNLQKWQNSLILKPSYQPLKAYKHLKNAS